MGRRREGDDASQGSSMTAEDVDEVIGAYDEFPIGLGCALDLFREKDEVIDILKRLPEVLTNESLAENTYQTYQKILDRYQEQPHLLDRHVEEMIEILLGFAREADTSPDKRPLKHLSLKFLRHIFKVRGPKEVVKRMPHEVADLVPVLEYLEKEDLEDSSTWESAYVFVHWLSILVINPFALKLLDGSGEPESIANRLLAVANKCIVLNNNVGQAAPILIAKFLTRPDMQERFLSSFIKWACDNLRPGPFGKRAGAFASLASIFKHAKRQEILPYGQQVLTSVLASGYSQTDTIIRKYGTKLLQRIGMMFMRTKIAPWRYQRGSRSLLKNLQATTPTNEVPPVKSSVNGTEEPVDLEDYAELTQYSEAIESILDKLLDGLRDKDTIVRWSAAKGIGRVTNRLPKAYADEVVESLLAILSPRETHGAWHGSCLALAELARRGLILPDRLVTVVPVIKQALIYDEIRGNFSVGGHVRDAACYSLWAFARAFDPKVVEPHVNDIATSLIITMVFDREVNCRRAASAAFQENVGRQGNFPHGIDIVTIADYFALGLKQNSYTKISIEIAQYEEYTRPLIDHLLALKFNHFDLIIRELSAETLGRLTKIDPMYMKDVIVPKLISSCVDIDIFTSHGAMISLGSILVRLKKMDIAILSADVLNSIRDIIPKVLEKRFKGNIRGNELLRQGICSFIKNCSQSNMPFHNEDDYLDTAHLFLEDSVESIDATTRLIAASAFHYFLLEYYCRNPKRKGRVGEFITVFCKNLQSPSITTAQGYAACLGRLPLLILQQDFPVVVRQIISAATIAPSTMLWAEVRRDALSSMAYILTKWPIVDATLSIEDDWNEVGIPISLLDYASLYDCCLTAMEDYTCDKRGDIGSWVRLAAMSCLKILTLRLHDCDPTGQKGLLDSSILIRFIGYTAKQCIEKIDNVRVTAGHVLAELLHTERPITALRHRDEIIKVFPKDFCEEVNWRATSVTFPRFVELLRIEDLTLVLFTGFAVAGGSPSESVLKDANAAITTYLVAAGAMGDGELERLGLTILHIFKTCAKVDRIITPLIKFTSQLLQSGLMLPLLAESADSFGVELVNVVKSQVQDVGKVDKIMNAIELLCETMQGSAQIVRISLKRLSIYLCHSFPKVRMFTASKLYEAFMTYGDTMEFENSGVVMNLLSDTQWSNNPNEIRPIRNRICELLSIPLPTARGSLSNTSMT